MSQETKSLICNGKEVHVTLNVTEHYSSQKQKNSPDQRVESITACSGGKECGVFIDGDIHTGKKCLHYLI
jgi:hypothetical protein